MSPVKVALLGLTHPHSLAHLRTLQALPEVDGIYLWDMDADVLEAVHDEPQGKIIGRFTDLQALLALPDLFLALVAVRNDMGPDLFVQVVNAGKHLMAEKPVGRSAADTQRVIDAANRSGVKLGVCYQNRANPVILDARSMVEQGLIGPLISIEMRMITTQIQFRDPSHWLFKQAQAGGGILAWLGCHYLDMMRFITQDEIVSVSAETAIRSGEQIDVEDVAVLALRFQSGAVGLLHAGYILAQSGAGYHNKAGYDVYAGINGRQGRITWSSSGAPAQMDVESTHEKWANAPKRSLQYTLAQSPAYGGVIGEQFIRDFIVAAQGKGSVRASGYDALQVARIVDAAYESQRTGRRIALPAHRATG